MKDWEACLAQDGSNGRKLHGAVIGWFLHTMVGQALQTTVDEMKDLDQEDFELWLNDLEKVSKQELGTMQRKSILMWRFGVSERKPAVIMPAVRVHAPPVPPPRVVPLADIGGDQLSVAGEQERAPSVASVKQVRELCSPADLEAQGLPSPIYALMISGCMITGVIPSNDASQVCLDKHGGNWVNSPHATSCRKARIKTLQDMRTGSFAELQAFFQNGVSEVQEAGLLQAALSLNKGWTTVCLSIGTGDDFVKPLVDYWWLYFTKIYRGRGLPVEVDTNLVVRVSSGSLLSEQVAASARVVAGLADQLEQSRTTGAAQAQAIAALTSRVAQLSAAVGNGGGGGGGGGGKGLGGRGGGLGEVQCYNCGELGHRAQQCPVKKAKLLALKEAAEQDGK